jgi:hypothetical protein
MAEVTDRDVLTDIQLKITSAGRNDEPAFNGGCPNNPSVHHTLDMVKDRITLVASPTGGCVRLCTEHKRVRSVDASKPQSADRLRDGTRIIPDIGREYHRRIAAALTNALDPRCGIPVEDGAIFGVGDFTRRFLHR